ncbi:MAG: MXAN_6640 family putative metalloprotease [bacterium]
MLMGKGSFVKGPSRFVLSRSLYVLSIYIMSAFLLLCRPGQSGARSVDKPAGFDNSGTADQEQMRAWLNQQIAALFPRKGRGLQRSASVPSSFFPRCATPLIRAALKHPELLDEQNRFILYRPTSGTLQDLSYGPVKVFVYNTTGGHFRIHYTLDSSQGDAVSASEGVVLTIPPYVLAVGKALEAAWAKEVAAMGYTPPSTLISFDGNYQLDCYIMGISNYGYSSIDQQNHPYMVISNNYSDIQLPPNQDPEGSALGAMKVTVAHEFFHAIQYGYTEWNDQWWEENSAVWMEDEVFDQVNDYLHYLGERYDDINKNGRWDAGESYYDSLGHFIGLSGRENNGWAEWPFLPLDASSLTYRRAPYQEYGGAIWVKHLAEKYGQDIVRSIFQRGRKILLQSGKGSNALDLIKAELISRGSSLASELEEFKIKVLTREFEEGEWYPQVWHVACFDNYKETALFDSDVFYDSGRGGFAGILNHLSSQYIRFLAPEGLGSVRIELTRTYGEAPLSCPLILTTRSGLIQRVNLPLNSATGSGAITLSGFGKNAELKCVEAIPINSSDFPRDDSIGFTIKADFEIEPYITISLLPGMNLFSPVLPEGQFLDSHQFILNYFTPDSLYSLSAYDQQTGRWIKNSLKGDSYSFTVPEASFSLFPGGIYLLNMKAAQTVTLPAASSSAGPETWLMRTGMNFFSFPPLQPDQVQGQKPVEDAFRLLQDLGDKISVITQKNHDDGKWVCAYRFFQKPAGENLAISGGKTSVVNMVQEEMWRRN